MTWWEVEEMAVYISDVEAALDEWAMSNPQMRLEQHAACAPDCRPGNR